MFYIPLHINLKRRLVDGLFVNKSESAMQTYSLIHSYG